MSIVCNFKDAFIVIIYSCKYSSLYAFTVIIYFVNIRHRMHSHTLRSHGPAFLHPAYPPPVYPPLCVSMVCMESIHNIFDFVVVVFVVVIVVVGGGGDGGGGDDVVEYTQRNTFGQR